MKNTIENLWAEKYRPTEIADCILPKKLDELFTKICVSGKLPNMLFIGNSGVGKTSVAKSLCKQLDLDYIIINASKDGNIDTLRNLITDFASSKSIDGKIKCVILDEADHLTPMTQAAFRNFLEEKSHNCRFIFTANWKNKIIDPLQSRLVPIKFATPVDERDTLVAKSLKRVFTILDKEKVQYDKRAVAIFVQKKYPDLRFVLNVLETFSNLSVKLDEEILGVYNNANINDLFKHLEAKDFTRMEEWVSENKNEDFAILFREIYSKLRVLFKNDSSKIPLAVIIMGDYLYKDSLVADREINFVAFLTTMMGELF